MTYEEVIETIKIAKAEVEWNYPMDYQIAMDDAIKCIEIIDRLEKLIPQNTPYCYTPIGYDEDYHYYHTKPCPYWDIEEVDWSKVEVDTPILVRNCDNNLWKKRYFAEYIDGEVYAWNSGRTRWSSYNSTEMTGWKYAKLAEREEE